jgi:hypothetical protein
MRRTAGSKQIETPARGILEKAGHQNAFIRETVDFKQPQPHDGAGREVQFASKFREPVTNRGASHALL